MTNTHHGKNGMTRRTLLAAGAATAAMAATTPGFAAIGTTPVEKPKCSLLHPLIGQNLAMYCDDASVSDMDKNLALKSAHCPQCAVHITPFGASVGHVRL